MPSGESAGAGHERLHRGPPPRRACARGTVRGRTRRRGRRERGGPSRARPARARRRGSSPARASSTSTPSTPGRTMSSAPPRPSAITGVPAASASTIVIPKSSSPTWMKPDARSYSRASSSRESQPRSSTFSGQRRAQRVGERADADHRQPVRQPAERLDDRSRVLVGDEPVRPEEAAGLLLGARIEVVHVDRRMHDHRVAAVEAPDPLRDRGRVRHVDVGPLRRLEILLAQPAGEQASRGRPCRASMRSGSACGSSRRGARPRAGARGRRRRATRRRPRRRRPGRGARSSAA